MARQFDVIVERDADGWLIASVPALPGCHTQAKSLDTLMLRVREAAELCLAAEGKDSDDLEFVGIQRMTIEA
jgi:predicted RNase H-like HicB family nuclease